MRYRKRRRSRGRRRMKEKKEGYKLTEKKVEEASKEKIKRYTKRYNGRRVNFGPSIKLLAPHETVGKRKCCDTQSVHGFSPHFTDFFPVRFSLDRVLLGFTGILFGCI